jgi:hypothetical protein
MALKTADVAVFLCCTHSFPFVMAIMARTMPGRDDCRVVKTLDM